MLRRRLLTAAVAAPALMLGERAVACTPILERERIAGSSVSPVGRAPTQRGPQAQCGGGYGPPPPNAPTWYVPPSPNEFYALLGGFSAAVGAKPFPGHYPVSSFPEAAQTMALRMDEYMEFEDVVNVAAWNALTIGAVIGATVKGHRGTILASAYVAAATVVIVALHSTMVFMHTRPAPSYGQDPSYFYVNGTMNAWIPNPGQYSGSIPVPPIPFPMQGGGGGGFVIPTYLLL